MYAWIVARLVRQGFDRLSAGEWRAVTAKMTDDVHFRFPGEHALAAEGHTRAEAEAWFRRAFEGSLRIELEVHDVLVRGWPWNTRVASRFTAHVTTPDGAVFHNPAMQFARLRWGRVTTDLIFEDTQMVARYAGG
jgi:ketosteroid isomerase-like protein